MTITFINNKERLNAPGLAYAAKKVSFHRGSQESDVASSSLMDEPPSKIDQHEPSHSCTHYT
jgi:hypothetical protein